MKNKGQYQKSKKERLQGHSHFNPDRSVDLKEVKNKKRLRHTKKQTEEALKIIYSAEDLVLESKKIDPEPEPDIENNLLPNREFKEIILDEADELIDAHMDFTDNSLKWRRFFWFSIFCGAVGGAMTIFGLSATVSKIRHTHFNFLLIFFFLTDSL